MRRRRWLWLAAVAALALGAVVWWLSIDPPLSEHEQRLVGTWTSKLFTGTGNGVWRFNPDRSSAYYTTGPNGTRVSADSQTRWMMRDDVLVVEPELNTLLRAIRPVRIGLGQPIAPKTDYRIEPITANAILLIRSDGYRQTWTRVPEK